MSGKVYFVGAPGRIKIGYTRQPEKRLQSLRVIDMEELTVIAVIDGSRATEKLLHEAVNDHRIRGEWFVDCAEVRSIILDAMAGKYASTPTPEIAADEAIETFTSFGNPTVLADCHRLADDLLNSLRSGEDRHDVKAKAAALIAVSEILVGVGGVQ